MNNLILGAGVTGLAAGFKTGFPILEATDKPGGICRSYNVGNFRFERGGGHWCFGPDYIMSFIEKYSHVQRYERKSGVYFNQIIPAPIQNYFSMEEPVNVGSMKSWLREKFGNELCRIFFYDFNAKYTDGLYDEIIQDDPKKSPKPNSKCYNDHFCYPCQGLDHFVDRLAKESNIRYGQEVVKINLDKRVLTLRSGECEPYDRLISTMPLNKLMQIAGCHDFILPYTSVLVLNIGARKGHNCPKEHWLYIPGDVPFFRVGFYSNVDKSFAPDGRVSIYVERAVRPGKTMEPNMYRLEVVRKLIEWGWIHDVETFSVDEIEVAYTWLTQDSEREEYLSFLKKHGIESIGRYGKWKFQGIAESIEDGLGVLL